MTFIEANFYGISTANSSCPSKPAQWCFDDYDGTKFCITNPTLIPLCLLALAIGLYSSKRISKLPGQFPSRWFYQLAFFLYGIMMTSAGILHCFLTNKKAFSNTNDGSYQFLQLLVTVIDVGLTSNIAITFLFCGLCDIKFFDPQSLCTRWLLFFTYFVIFLLWTVGLLNHWSWIFHVLYLGIVGISCLIFLITQLFLKPNRRAITALIVGGIYGALGLLATSYGAEHICKSEGPFWSQYIGPEFIWFLFSDISMAFMFVYVIRAHQENRILARRYTYAMDDYPEKI